ncbi:hypothetical protein [Streptomyces sp. JJ38]|uniref:hypothetical protein n=1 Tax=Streptomyces sp. JJ38 TaxID=2738128 RepID=UPI001C57F2FB|nr:hypothetical protein [Streptomyces sp. JJ38]MBW1596962.1 hypothetical protein [Streptomyces sp. JJ38]
MAQDNTYVRINGEVSEGRFEWAHHPRTVWLQAGPLGLFGGAAFGGIGGAMADAEGGSVWLWAVLAGLLGVLFVGGIAYYMAAARMELKDGVLRVSTGQKKVNVPVGAIAYIGKAEFSRSNRWRMSRKNIVVEPGPGIEMVSRDGQYITVSTTHADAVFQELLRQGMRQDALRVPFPEQAVSAKPPVSREQRLPQR